ncbi:MAG: riboflavin biosynthesis protein RibF [Candidatus Omnitrophica bacterium]|nr:riboflavin biosynthesis protein RibF [Candidatus Omnitrophota bacterium]
MKVIFGRFQSDRRPECAVTIGVFDGVHQGHRKIIEKTVSAARAHSCAAWVITFDPPPAGVLSPSFPGVLTNTKEKTDILRTLGVDGIWVMDTDRDLLNQSAADFLGLLAQKMKMRVLVGGEDFRFGREQLDINTLSGDGSWGFSEVLVVPKEVYKGNAVSSTRIRCCVREGEFSVAARLMGRPYCLRGPVVPGQGIGRTMGFPTLNVARGMHVVPSPGVYAAAVGIRSAVYLAGVNVGRGPTHSRGGAPLKIEAHLIDYPRDAAAPAECSIRFLEKIREEQRFPSRQELAQAIGRDIGTIRSRYGGEFRAFSP